VAQESQKLANQNHSFAHAKVKKSIFNRKILELVGDSGIILNDFHADLSQLSKFE